MLKAQNSGTQMTTLKARKIALTQSTTVISICPPPPPSWIQCIMDLAFGELQSFESNVHKNYHHEITCNYNTNT